MRGNMARAGSSHLCQRREMHGELLGAGPTTGTNEVDTLGPMQSLKTVSAEPLGCRGAPHLRGQSEQRPEEQDQGTRRPRPRTGWETAAGPEARDPAGRAPGCCSKEDTPREHTLAESHR